MTRKQARLYSVLFFVLGFSVAVGLVLIALKDNISYFRTPTEITSGSYPERNSHRGLRVGGMVEKGSVERHEDLMTFRITDFANSLTIRYKGIVPDLFREGQGVVAEGHMIDGIFIADRILAKHDEKYMPPEVAGALAKGTSLSPPTKSLNNAQGQ